MSIANLQHSMRYNPVMPDSINGPKRPNRTMIEVSPATRRRLRRVAVERDITIKELTDELSKRAEMETFGKIREDKDGSTGDACE